MIKTLIIIAAILLYLILGLLVIGFVSAFDSFINEDGFVCSILILFWPLVIAAELLIFVIFKIDKIILSVHKIFICKFAFNIGEKLGYKIKEKVVNGMRK